MTKRTLLLFLAGILLINLGVMFFINHAKPTGTTLMAIGLIAEFVAAVLFVKNIWLRKNE